MKTILTIILIFVCFGLQDQIKEKWVDTDSLNAVKAEIDTGNIKVLSINNSEPIDTINDLNEVMQVIDSILININGVFGLPSYNSDPTPIREGQKYFNQVTKKERIWNGTIWVEY